MMNRIFAAALLLASPVALPVALPALARAQGWAVANAGGSVPKAPVLEAESSWVGNTFGGARGRWVQVWVDEIEVSPEGRVYTASDWDEAGRCTGIYTDGDVFPDLLKQYDGKGGHKAWGWGTASYAVAIDGGTLYILNTAGELVSFDGASGKYLGTTPLLEARKEGGKEIGRAIRLACAGGMLALVRDTGEVQVRRLSDLKAPTSTWSVPGARDVAMDRRGNLWVLAGTQVLPFSREGRALPGRIAALEPSAISLDAQGRLLVCDNAPSRRQVLFYDVSGMDSRGMDSRGRAPRLVRAFGVPGGIASRAGGGPGAVAPDKMFHIAGAGTDARGNLFVALSGGNWDGTILRCFRADGRGGWKGLAWQVDGHHFLDSIVLDPASEGRVAFGSEERYEMDYSRPTGKQWAFRGYTFDPAAKDDPRRTDAANHAAFARRVPAPGAGRGGRLLLYMTNMYTGPLHIYGFERGSEFARLLYSHERALKGWGVWADGRGDLWECAGKRVARIPLQGFDSHGRPRFGPAQFFEGPAPLENLQRVQYFPATDTLYLAGYTPKKKEQAWGIVGKVLARIDNWSKGNRTLRWVMDVPHDFAEPGAKNIMKEFAVEGDYIFFVGVETKGRVFVFRSDDGQAVGVLQPGEAVGGVDSTGWVDMPHTISAVRRRNGEYVVFIEEDARAKVLMYRWKPAA